jgi:signal transduction histidine kinase
MSRSTILDDAGDPAGGVLVMRDVAAEEALERMKADFLANISHELRTPLTPIRGYTSLLQSRQLPPAQQAEFLNEISHSTARLERIVGILVDFAALESGRFTISRETVDVGDLVKDVAGRWDGRSAGHPVSAKVAAGLPPVMADPEALKRALSELIDNGVKYSPDGGPVEIWAEAGNGTVTIEVRDRGLGFDETRLPELMQEFTQGDASSTRQFGGLGLGLPFARRIAEAYGGRLVGRSRPGLGSTFALQLPAARS